MERQSVSGLPARCAYCYARPSHQYWGWGAGTDFESKLIVKTNAAELLRSALGKPSWKRETIVFSGNTDCYQPLEKSYELTRRCLQACLDYRSPALVITKGALVRRDVDVLTDLARRARAAVHVSVAFTDEAVARSVEPYASSPRARFKTIGELARAGLRVGVSLSPVIPGLNDSEIPAVLERAADAGAESAFMNMLRLPREVLPVFQERIGDAFPGRAAKVMSAVAEVRGGKTNESQFGERMRGRGPRWDAIAQLFDVHCRRLGLDRTEGPDPPAPVGPAQRSLFD